MTIPRTLLGEAGGNRILLVGEGHRDGVDPLPIRATTNPFAPAGASMDCSFDRLFITLTHSGQVHLRCTPIVNGEHITAAAFDIELPPPVGRRSHVHEEPLFRDSAHGRYMEGLRGTWFQLQIDSVQTDDAGNMTGNGIYPGDLILDEITLEWESLSPTVQGG
ncbi:MAG: hypothetical protein OXH68_15185 [Gammaproteobacteria bacterium]|nr:hypothetical protein [Gammaproteobacteria bacterium]